MTPACDCGKGSDEPHTHECAWFQYMLEVEDSEIDWDEP